MITLMFIKLGVLMSSTYKLGPYSLDNYNYSFPEVFWESPIKHGEISIKDFRAAEYLSGIAHFCIALIEAVPILGQIASIIEMLACRCFGEIQNKPVENSETSTKNENTLGVAQKENKIIEKELNKGFLYEVKKGQHTIAYLCGTQHYMPKSWSGLNTQIETALHKSRKVFLEAIVNNNDEELKRNLNAAEMKLGVDYEITAIAKEKKTPIEALNTPELRLNQLLVESSINFKMQMAIQMGQYNFQKNINDETKSWQIGDDVGVCSSVAEKAKFVKEELKEFIGNSNESWMIKISKELASQSKEANTQPLFIGVGCVHLFDCDEISEGLITRIRNLQYTVEKTG